VASLTIVQFVLQLQTQVLKFNQMTQLSLLFSFGDEFFFGESEKDKMYVSRAGYYGS
jgi:hypothetical protein